MSLIVYFDEPEAGLVSRVGGKGSNLITLTAAGFPVPPGFVITADAYQLFLDRIDWLERELATFDYDHPDRLREQCARLRSRLAEVAFPCRCKKRYAPAWREWPARPRPPIRSRCVPRPLSKTWRRPPSPASTTLI